MILFRDREFERRVERDQAVGAGFRARAARLAALPPPLPRRCCWPSGDPGTTEFRLCDDVVVRGRPYCSEHCGRAYSRRSV